MFVLGICRMATKSNLKESLPKWLNQGRYRCMSSWGDCAEGHPLFVLLCLFKEANRRYTSHIVLCNKIMYQDVEGYMLTVSSSSCYYDFMPLSTMHFCWGRQGIEEWAGSPREELVPLSRAKVQIPIYPRELPNSALLFGVALCSLSRGIWSTGQSTFLGERDAFCSMIPCHSCKNQHNFKRE